MVKREVQLENDPLWYKDAVIYQLHVKTFYDSNGDGIGDFKGLTLKLDYLKDLGINAIWLLPFYPSPLKDDGYDIADYFKVHSNYGTIRDFKKFLREAHSRGIRIITELVVNHTSDQHEWFQKSRRSKSGSKWRDFFVWSDTPDKYQDARIIFKDFENSNWAWDPVAKSYYWHRFYSHQPDLNYDNPEVQQAIFRVIDFWMNMGVDGMRLDAVPYLFEREGTNCENLPETNEFLKKLRAHVDRNFENRMLLAEANQWPEDVIEYFGEGDECHMAYHFPIMPRMYMASWMEDRFPLVDIMDQTPEIPENCQWALFLRNHDELTLEMVTDEERDYMYRVYAKDTTARINLGIRRRLSPLLGNHRRKLELMNFLLFSLPGTPITYYGDEIGMGDNYYLGDRNGVRTPMQWSADRNAGFSRANPQKLYLPVIIDPEYHYESVNVENQERNLSSFLWWMRRVINMRKRFKAFGRAGIQFLHPENPKIIAFIREYGEETILVVMNLSRFSQVVELDLSAYEGCVPVEVFSKNRFPVITETPYVFTLGFHDYFWFLIRSKEDEGRHQKSESVPDLSVSGYWHSVFRGKSKAGLEEDVFARYLLSTRWFSGKSKKISGIEIFDDLTVERLSSKPHLLLLRVNYIEDQSDIYFLPVGFATGEEARRIFAEHRTSIIANLECADGEGVIYDAVFNEDLRSMFFSMIAGKNSVKGRNGRLTGQSGKALRDYINMNGIREPGKSQVLKVEQSNTSILYGNRYFLKIFRKLDEGVNPDQELGSYLTNNTDFQNIPPYLGTLDYRNNTDMSLGILQGYIQNEGDAWRYTHDSFHNYFERVLARKREGVDVLDNMPPSVAGQIGKEPPPVIRQLIGEIYIDMIGLLGQRTAELHIALASEQNEKEFAPEPFSLLYQRSLFQSMNSLTKRVFQSLRRKVKDIGDDIRPEAESVLAMEKEIRESFRSLYKNKFSAMKIRIHGDYHLGQVLWMGNDFTIIDFEGEPLRPLGERRLKKSPIRDVTGMIRSFHYAAYSALFSRTQFNGTEFKELEMWSELWYRYVAGQFLGSYLRTAKGAAFIPDSMDELEIMLRCYLLEKAVYEIGYEMDNRPDWLIIPLKGVKSLMEDQGD